MDIAQTAVALKPATTIKELSHQLSQLVKQPNVLQQLSIELAAPDLLGLLAANPNIEQCYWQDKSEQVELAGFGNAVELVGHNEADLARQLTLIDQLNATTVKELLWFSGFAFRPDRSASLPYCYFRLPQMTLMRDGQRTFLLLHIYGNEQFYRQRQQLLSLLTTLSWQPKLLTGSQFNRLFSIRHDTDYPSWQQSIAKLLAAIEAGEVDKVVLSRQSQIRTARAICPHALLKRWRALRPNGYGFMLQYGAQHFVGHSPEQLFRRQGQCLSTDALAGTVPLDQPEALATLANDQKLIHEHALVANYIEHQLRPLASAVVRSQVQPLQLRNIAHRHCTIQAALHRDTATMDIINSLHPTPAVGGFPRQQALAYIQQHDRSRGWYAGGVGVIGRHRGNSYADFSVAIRCALIAHNKMTCFTGVGIVKGSDPAIEWTELDNKLTSVLEALHG